MIDGGSRRDSLVGLLQPMDLPLQFKVVGAACSHPIEEEEEGELLMKSEKKVVGCSGAPAPAPHF